MAGRGREASGGGRGRRRAGAGGGAPLGLMLRNPASCEAGRKPALQGDVLTAQGPAPQAPEKVPFTVPTLAPPGGITTSITELTRFPFNTRARAPRGTRGTAWSRWAGSIDKGLGRTRACAFQSPWLGMAGATVIFPHNRGHLHTWPASSLLVSAGFGSPLQGGRPSRRARLRREVRDARQVKLWGGKGMGPQVRAIRQHGGVTH